MIAKSPAPETRLLLFMLDQAFDKKAWHGPNLRGAIRRVTAAQAAWRPGPKRRSIADIVVHAAYWKYAVRRRLRGDKRGSFPLKGSNWFALANPLSEDAWREYVRLLDSEHTALRAAVEALSDRQLGAVPPGSRITHGKLIYSIALHDVYHAGQIQTLKALQKNRARK